MSDSDDEINEVEEAEDTDEEDTYFAEPKVLDIAEINTVLQQISSEGITLHELNDNKLLLQAK